MLIPTANDIKTITDMRENALELLKQIQKRHQPLIIIHRNDPKALMLSPKRYNEIIEQIHDYKDEILAAKLEQKPKKGGISLEKIAQEIGVNLNE